MSKTKSKDGTRIAFECMGAGPAIILVHPAFGYRAFDPAMAALARTLAEQFTVLTYDRRGRGESGDTPPYAVDREVEDLDALIAEAGASAFVYGMSSGAVLALEAASRGLAAAKLAVYEPPFIVDGTRPPLPPEYVSHVDELVRSGRRGDAVAYAMGTFGVAAEVVQGMRSQPMWPGFEAVAHTLVYDGIVMGDTQRGRALPKRFASIRVPTLVVVGAAVPDWMRNSAKALVEKLPDAQLIALEGQFHAVAPEVLASALTEFFETDARTESRTM